MKQIFTKAILAGMLLLLTIPSCVRVGISPINPGPPILMPLIEQFPMKSQIDSLLALNPNTAPEGLVPMMPFTYGSVTVEGWYWVNYTSPIIQPIFAGTGDLMNYDVTGFFGACDIGFYAE
jgi:hypothetical protein